MTMTKMVKLKCKRYLLDPSIATQVSFPLEKFVRTSVRGLHCKKVFFCCTVYNASTSMTYKCVHFIQKTSISIKFFAVQCAHSALMELIPQKCNEIETCVQFVEKENCERVTLH